MRTSYQYPWQKAYFDAVSDLGAVTLCSKIALARTALDERIAELLKSKRGDAERQAIVNALFSLHFLELYSGKHIGV